ncbi:site-specific recombinase [Dyadobacter sp. LHD-138]|uniref:site-specific recombinase n=1 Tax=Dyadobacter sp. LHD-138 TaxID=3071413 RepID=UPI0027E14ADE|nr:site-specific recombinase [Dyadobacter sp. LHD-138]MDQ6477323.1 site-specific recombinase [Dyadobacter sp. LHD-138]
MNSVSAQSRLNYVGKFIEIIRSSYKAKVNQEIPFADILTNILMDRREKDLLAEQIYSILLSTKFVSLLTESEIGSNKGFFSDASTRLSYKFLPPVHEPDELRTQFDGFFDDKKDYQWVQAIPDENWCNFFADIFRDTTPTLSKYVAKEMLNAILVLAQRAANLGIEPEVVSKIPRVDDLDSPFLGLNREVMMYVEKMLNTYDCSSEDRDNDYKHILVMISQCNTQVSYIYKHKDLFGISLQLTYMMRQLEQYLKRLTQLLDLLQSEEKSKQWLIITHLLKEFVYAENTRYSLRKHFSINLQLLTFKVIENTSKTGEHYIASDKSAYWKLFRRAMGGGAIVGLLCCNKTRLYFQHLPIFWEAFFYSLNYSIGFMLIHILGYTIATKQPAMTASTIAANLSNNGQNPNWLESTTQLLIKLIRSQFISLVGNASIAFPIAYGLDWLYFYFNGFHIADPAKAHKLIAELNAWESLAIPHAAIAGFYLMVSGLISGYYENKWIYNKYSLRLMHHPGLIRLLGQERLDRTAHYFERNFGALAGNFSLGVFLGSTSAIGFTFGLPLDIRHITFASGNFGIAFAGLNSHISADLWINSIIGIACIGTMNVLVSFGLSIAFALKSRNARFSEIKSLLGNLSWQFFHHGAAFFFPVKEAASDEDELPEVFVNKQG